ATIARRERLWARGGESRPAHLRNFPKKNWKRACLPASRHPGEPIGTGVAIAVRILATGHLAECPLLGRTGDTRMAGMTGMTPSRRKRGCQNYQEPAVQQAT